MPERNEGWQRLRNAFDEAREQIAQSEADLLIIYSTTWPSIIGHQIQADPNPTWTLVVGISMIWVQWIIRFESMRNLQRLGIWPIMRFCKVEQSHIMDFPIDVGSVVALKLLNPDNAIPAVIVSSNVYANRAETTVLAKACLDVLVSTERRRLR